MRDISLEEEQAIRERCKNTNSGMFAHGVTTYKCPIDEKDFVISDSTQWVYKRKTRAKRKNESVLYFCSYKCCRVYDKIFENRGGKTAR